MEISNQEVEIPIPINSSYGHGHGHMVHHEPAPPHHNHIIPSNGSHIVVPTTTALEEVVDQDHHNVPYNNNNNNKIRRASTILYRECLKNHAASMGGNATDGCGEFMPSGLEGTLESLTCSACHCHRNFHRKEVEGEPMINPYDHCYLNRVGLGRKVILGHHKAILGPESVGYPSRAAGPIVPHQQHQMMMSSYHVNSESDDQEGSGGVGIIGNRAMTGQHHQGMMKKRFRTKFSQEQKEKMLGFAERVGWKIQKQEESVVQQFCQEIGVKRRVLKVWMHNNKHNLAKKNSSINAQDDHM